MDNYILSQPNSPKYLINNFISLPIMDITAQETFLLVGSSPVFPRTFHRKFQERETQTKPIGGKHELVYERW
jgi:hypothetical protein